MERLSAATKPTKAEVLGRLGETLHGLAFLVETLADQAHEDALPKPKEARLLRVAEAAERLSCSTSTIYEMLDRGELPLVRLGKGAKRVPAVAIERLGAGGGRRA